MDAINNLKTNSIDPRFTGQQTQPAGDSIDPAQIPPPKDPSEVSLPTSMQDVMQMASELAAHLELLGQGHQVAIRNEEDTGRPIVEVRSKEGKILNTFPPEKILNLQRVLDDLSGMVINRMT